MAELDIRDIKRMESAVKDARNITIVTHTKPDGDAMGSAVAMYHFTKAVNCAGNTCIVISDSWPRHLDFLMDGLCGNDITIHADTPEKAEALLEESDLMICLDFNAYHRTDNLEKALERSEAAKILIDHHLNPDRDCFDIVFSETEISSASELLYSILLKTEAVSGEVSRLPAKAAEALMTGMTTDTNNFANSTYPSTLIMASELLAAGVDRDHIISELYNQYRENRIRIMGYAMKDLLKITPYGVAYIVLDKKTLKDYDIEEGETEGFVNMPLSIASVRMSLLLKEDEGKVRVSIRSRKGTSANRCARLHFNGGGHENAAGGKLYIPQDIKDISQAAAYIEDHTYMFLKEEDEK